MEDWPNMSDKTYRSHRAYALARDIAEGIRSQSGRAGLSFFSVAIGIVSFTVLLAVLGGLREKARAILDEFGANVVELRPGDGDRFLTAHHQRIIATGLEGCDVSCSVADSITSAQDKPIEIIRTDDRLDDVRGLRVSEGRFLDRRDVVNRERHAVVTRRLAEQERIGLGGRLAADGMAFRVVGIIEAAVRGDEQQESDSGFSTGRATMFIPWTLVFDRDSVMDRHDILDALLIRLGPGVRMRAIMDRAARLLSAPDVRLDVQWTTPDQLLEGTRRLQRTIRLSAGSVTLLCLVLGGTTLTSLMLANVRDRVREIGLRRALGATPRDIAALFVAEACCITGAASVAGLLAATFILVLARDAVGVPLKLGISTFLLPVVASILLGGVFSFWPARVAARIEPAEALRNE
jgi:putative ABC transport system permease protein